jgi:SAM-dependent methyltransferase
MVVDVACGPGRVAAQAALRGAIATGVDLAPGMVALARSLHPGIEFHEAEVGALPFEDASFDALACSFGLGHFPDPERATAECGRVVAPGGRLAFAWWDDPARHRLQAMFREAASEVGAPTPPNVPVHSTLRFCDADEFRGLLEGAGLIDVEVRGHTTEHRVQDTEALWEGGLGSLAMTAAAIVHQPDEVRGRIRSAFERRAAAYRTRMASPSRGVPDRQRQQTGLTHGWAGRRSRRTGGTLPLFVVLSTIVPVVAVRVWCGRAPCR